MLENFGPNEVPGLQRDCCREPNPTLPRMNVYRRTELVEAFPTVDGDYMAVRAIPSVPERTPLTDNIPTDDLVFIPIDVFNEHYSLAEER